MHKDNEPIYPIEPAVVVEEVLELQDDATRIKLGMKYWLHLWRGSYEPLNIKVI